jgi:2-polyprenyl-6-methoxyphenol hydroxylase-like FAD-dependent oxidoreductase
MFAAPEIFAPSSRFDVVILGGGPAGFATAIALKRQDPACSVAVVARPPGPKEKIGETLPPGARSVLAALGLWETFVADGHQATYGSRAAWGGPEPFENDFFLHPEQRGWLLDRPRFDARLAAAARDAGCLVFPDAHFVECEAAGHSRSGWRIHASLPGAPDLELTARFVVDATGRSALVAERQGAARIADDRLVAITGLFHDAAGVFAEDGSPLVETCDAGWWYSAALPGRRGVATFFTDADLARELRVREPAGWDALLARSPHTRRRLAAAQADGLVHLRPADSVILDRLAGANAAAGWLAVGDAASTFDPLSSHGIVKAMRQATFAAYAILDHLRGVPIALEKYAALLRHEFAEFLTAKREFYREETRWAASPFWRRRQGLVWLSPDMQLERAASRPAASALHLSPSGHARLWQACDRRRSSREVVACFATGAETGAADITGLQVILALQHLVEEGALVRSA